jgi:hypothetical protein
MDSRREGAIQNFIATMPTAEAFIPAMVDACDVGARREQLVQAISRDPVISVFETKYRAALAQLSTEEIEDMTALFARQPGHLITALLKWASGLAWAATELKEYIDGEYDRLVSGCPS